MAQLYLGYQMVTQTFGYYLGFLKFCEGKESYANAPPYISEMGEKLNIIHTLSPSRSVFIARTYALLRDWSDKKWQTASITDKRISELEKKMATKTGDGDDDDAESEAEKKRKAAQERICPHCHTRIHPTDAPCWYQDVPAKAAQKAAKEFQKNMKEQGENQRMQCQRWLDAVPSE